MFPFDRLIRAVDAMAANSAPQTRFFAQIGAGNYEPKHMRFVRFVAREEFGALVAGAEVVISHAGIGTIAETLKFGKPILVLPRRQAMREHVNDHQVGTARRFSRMGHVLLAETEFDLPRGLELAMSFKPMPRIANPQAIVGRIAELLATCDRERMKASP
jgi:UDP-N-acetylglucosamine transferase subunit ALG13